MGKKLVVDVGKCTGCDSCVVSCSFKHTGAFSMQARIQVEKVKDQGLFVPIMCKQCTDAPCVEVCPTGALFKDKDTGETKLQTDECIGCDMCIQECPFGAITHNEKAGHVEKCDLCGGDPICAKVCIPGAVRYADVNEPAKTKRAETVEKYLVAQQTAVAKEG